MSAVLRHITVNKHIENRSVFHAWYLAVKSPNFLNINVKERFLIFDRSINFFLALLRKL